MRLGSSRRSFKEAVSSLLNNKGGGKIMLSEGNESFFDKAFMLTVLLVFLFLPLTVGAETSQAQSNTVPAANVAPGEQPLAVEVAEYAGKGDYNTGKALFTGEKTFVNGGPPCISCHNAGVGELGGGCLAPDLTKAYADPTKNALLSTAWVNGGGSPVMGPIFSNKKVTDEEMDHLRAFFKTCSEKPVRPASTGTFAIFGLGGSVGLLILFSLIWSGRYSKRNQDTAHDALWRNYGGKGGR